MSRIIERKAQRRRKTYELEIAVVGFFVLKDDSDSVERVLTHG